MKVLDHDGAKQLLRGFLPIQPVGPYACASSRTCEHVFAHVLQPMPPDSAVFGGRVLPGCKRCRCLTKVCPLSQPPGSKSPKCSARLTLARPVAELSASHRAK